MMDQSTDKTPDKYKVFEDWLRLNGAEFSLVSICYLRQASNIAKVAARTVS
jgi:hypothetical protein